MSVLAHILTASVSLTIISIALSAVGGLIAFHQGGGSSLGDCLRYLFPRDLISRRYVGFIFVKRLMRPWVVYPFLLLTPANCVLETHELLVSTFTMSVALFFGLLLAAVSIQDFLRFGSHYLLHHIGILWDVHKVHHSADFFDPRLSDQLDLKHPLLRLAGLIEWTVSRPRSVRCITRHWVVPANRRG